MDLNGINTQNNAAAIRATIYSGVLRTQLEPELIAMKYVDVISNFPDGDKWQDVEIGNATVHDYVEGSDVTFDGLAIGTRDFEINRYLYSGHFITEKFSQDAYLAAQIAAKIPAIEARAIMAKLEKDIFALESECQTANDENVVDGYKHRFAAGYVDGSSGDVPGTITPSDISYGVAALDSLLYTGPKVMIVPSFQQHLIGTFGDLAKLSFNPKWEGIVREGAVSGIHFAFSIYGVDVYVSNFLPKVTETLEMSSSSTSKTVTDGAVALMFANIPDRRPFRMAWRMMPKFEGRWVMEKRREEYLTVGRYGVGAGDTKNLIGIVCKANPATAIS
jgi:hypothetical protein